MTDATPTGPGSEEHDALTPGTTFAGHRIEEVIGHGGMGIVYRARHLSLDRERALKVVAPQLSADQRFRERFKRESRLAAQVEHPNVIPVHHAGEESGQLYLAMRLVDGVDLRRLVEASGPLDPAHAVRVLAGIAAGLDAAHAGGLIHRDVKPANVLVERDGDAERIFLTDFGISRLAGSEESLTATGEFFGSVDYVAPEQIEGEPVDARTDVYALGGVLHFMLTGGPPFPRDTELAKLFAHANASRPRPSESVPGLPAAIDDVVAKAMAKRPEERYGSAGELAARGRGGARGARAGARPAGSPTASVSRRRRQRRDATTATVDPASPAARDRGAGGARRGRGRRGRGALERGWLRRTAAGRPAAERLGRRSRSVRTSRDHGRRRTRSGWRARARRRRPHRSRHRAGRAADPHRRPPGLGRGRLRLDLGRQQERRHARAARPGGGHGADRHRPRRRPANRRRDRRALGMGHERDSDNVSQVDPETNSVAKNVYVGPSPRAVATGEGGVWVANIDDSSVSKINPRTAERTGVPIEVGQRPDDLAVGFGSVWVIDNYGGTLTRIDPDTLSVQGDEIDVGSHPRGVKTGFGYVWVANGEDGTVTRIDPETLAPAGPPIPVGRNPADIAVGLGSRLDRQLRRLDRDQDQAVTLAHAPALPNPPGPAARSRRFARPAPRGGCASGSVAGRRPRRSRTGRGGSPSPRRR